MGVFKKLFDLQLGRRNRPLEDYTTELFAYCLENNDALLNEFLKEKIGLSSIENASITTQYSLEKLENHDKDSRPDIVIFLDNATIFFENKISALEGDKQLQRYAEHLDRIRNEKKALVYLTRDFEEKDEKEILKNCNPEEVEFIQLRWHEVFNFLKDYKDNPIVLEFQIFMKQIGLSMNNQFTPVDLLTLSNFSKVRKMLDESMSGEVSKKFEKINGKISQNPTSVTELRRHDRYIYKADHQAGIWIGYGYWMNSKNEKDYPDVSIHIQVDPKSNKKEEIIKSFSAIDISNKFSEWKGYNLHDLTAWAGVNTNKSLQSFLSEENQIKTIQDYFIEKLGELEKIITEFDLPINKK